MANQIAVVYTNMDGSAGIACKKTEFETVHRLALDADERYLCIHIIKDDPGGPYVDQLNGHDVVTVGWNEHGKSDGVGGHHGRLNIRHHDITPAEAREHSWTTEPVTTSKLSRPIPDKLVSVASLGAASFAFYDQADWEQKMDEATSWDVLDDAKCEIV